MQWDEPAFKDVSVHPIPLGVTKGTYKAEGSLTITKEGWDSKHKPVDLRKCYIGDKLLSQHGEILVYRGPSGNPKFPHAVEYSNGGYGSRTDDGYVMSCPNKRLETDHNIMKILPRVWELLGGNSRDKRKRRRAAMRTNLRAAL